MILLENIKRIAEKATGWRRPEDAHALLRQRKPQTYRFTDDGIIPNHPRWPLILYKSAIRLPECFDPAAVLEELFDSRGWGSSWRGGIYDYVHFHSHIHEVLGVARGSGRVRFGGAKGRSLTLKAGDAAILPAGTGHQRLKASEDFLVVGAYPTSGAYDECTTPEDRKKALPAIPRATRPRKDPVYGKDGPLMGIWTHRVVRAPESRAEEPLPGPVSELR
jgi:uncharacterized protein YjlB